MAPNFLISSTRLAFRVFERPLKYLGGHSSFILSDLVVEMEEIEIPKIDASDLKYPVDHKNLIPGHKYYGIYITYDGYPKEDENLVLGPPSFHGRYVRTNGLDAIFNHISFLPNMPLYNARYRISDYHFYSSQKPVETVMDNKAKQLAVMDMYEEATGQSGLPQDGPVQNILGYAGIGRSKGFKSGGSYKPTRKNRAALRKWKKGESIGFTMRASLKAKGLIPRTSRKNRGKKIISNKYK